MKINRIVALVALSFSPALASAQGAPAPTTPPAPATPASPMEHHTTGSGWKELDDFHTVMAATWHPVSRNNDLSVIRQKADSLVASAKAWMAATVPTPCNTPAIKTAMADVLKGSEKVAELVRNRAADAELRAALHDVHERFEVVEEGCHPRGHGDH